MYMLIAFAPNCHHGANGIAVSISASTPITSYIHIDHVRIGCVTCSFDHSDDGGLCGNYSEIGGICPTCCIMDQPARV